MNNTKAYLQAVLRRLADKDTGSSGKDAATTPAAAADALSTSALAGRDGSAGASAVFSSVEKVFS